MMAKTSTSIMRPAFSYRPRGFSLIDLMVGLAVGLIVTFVVLSTFATITFQRRTTVSANDAKESGQFALNTVERVAKLAGSGLFYNGQLICSSLNVYYNNTTISNGAPLAPVKIVDGGSTGSDSITVAYANAVGGISVSHLVDNMPNTSANFTVGNKGNLANGELAIIGVPGSNRPCTLFQVTGFPPGGGNCNGITSSCLNVQHNSGQSAPYNPANPNVAFTDAPRYGYQDASPIIGPAVISRFGNFNHDTYEVMCDSLVSHSVSATASCTTSPLVFSNAAPLVSNIVMLKAQYGITASAGSDVVSNWVNATGIWQNPAFSDLPRIKAIRIVVVSRSAEPAASAVSNACTNANSIVNTGPCSFQDAESPVIDLSNIPVMSGRTWQNYRYRVYQSVIPLRNVLWSY
jgi:type IV pilus assembly protein PilW